MTVRGRSRRTRDGLTPEDEVLLLFMTLQEHRPRTYLDLARHLFPDPHEPFIVRPTQLLVRHTKRPVWREHAIYPLEQQEILAIALVAQAVLARTLVFSSREPYGYRSPTQCRPA